MEDVKNWINDWVELFPKNVQSGGISIRSKPEHCLKKMVKFCKDNPDYTKSIIFAATKKYLSNKEEEQWKFTKRATYFISKQGEESLLEIYCDREVNGGEEEFLNKPVEQLEDEYDGYYPDINNYV